MSFTYVVYQPIVADRTIYVESDTPMSRDQIIEASYTLDGEVNWGDNDTTQDQTVYVCNPKTGREEQELTA